MPPEAFTMQKEAALEPSTSGTKPEAGIEAPPDLPARDGLADLPDVV